MSVMILRGLARLGTGQMQAGEVQGPVGIAKISGSALQQGIIPFILLTAVISINLGLINLLPIPALDGGHLVFFFYEALVGKPLPLELQNLLLRGGIAILMGLMAVLVVFDVARLIG
jgi:regulator of sigma E protease